ncbi:MAG: SDR family NAD(P)-dependent oxidoreductase [Myxococcota bacterium]
MSPKIAIVTGANRGLGREVAHGLARRGMTVVVTGRRLEPLAAVVESIEGEGHRAEAAVLDVSSDESVDAFAAGHLARLSRVDVLVNNAGAIFEATNDRGQSSAASPLVVPTEIVAKALNTNTLGAYRLLRHVLPIMNAQGHGRVVNVSSGMGALGDMDGGWPAYRISKTALHAVTRVFYAEAAAGVKVNAVCPGWVRTDMGGAAATRSVPEGAASILIAATLPDDGPSGVFLRDGETIDW